ncbi:hypothetical protein BDZ89DRAFT_728120 [Hymenopellis radicata]|nr:hypothetical protein BDZ89DRAFT_728120 [Hymenopellis radicata]
MKLNSDLLGFWPNQPFRRRSFINDDIDQECTWLNLKIPRWSSEGPHLRSQRMNLHRGIMRGFNVFLTTDNDVRARPVDLGQYTHLASCRLTSVWLRAG